MSNLVLVPHACIYSHRWDVLLPYAYEYSYPYHRFCPTCLEQGRIEVGSIELVTTYDGRVEYTCPVCRQRTIIPLIPDFSFMGMTREFLDGLEMPDWFTRKTRWFRLPRRWPVMCEHALDRDETGVSSRRTKGKEPGE